MAAMLQERTQSCAQPLVHVGKRWSGVLNEISQGCLGKSGDKTSMDDACD